MADVNFNLANPYQTQLDELARRQKMAEIMQQQSFQPTERFSYAGIEAPISPLAGLTKALQGYMGGKAQRDIAEESKKVGEKYQSDLMNTMTRANELAMGKPAVAEGSFKPETADFQDNPNLALKDGMGVIPAVPAVAPNPQAAAMEYFKHPATQAMGMAEMQRNRNQQEMINVLKGMGAGSPSATAPQALSAEQVSGGAAGPTNSAAARVSAPNAGLPIDPRAAMLLTQGSGNPAMGTLAGWLQTAFQESQKPIVGREGAPILRMNAQGKPEVICAPSPKRDRGQVFDYNTRTVSTTPGFLGSSADITRNTEQAKAAFELVDVPMPGGGTQKMSKADALQYLLQKQAQPTTNTQEEITGIPVQDIAKARAAGIPVNTPANRGIGFTQDQATQSADKTRSEKRATNEVAREEQLLRTGYQEAQSMINNLDLMQSLASDPNVAQGKLADQISGLKSVAQSLGIRTEGLPAEEAIRAISVEMALKAKNQGGTNLMPGAMAVAETQLLQSMTPQLAQSRDGRDLLIQVFRQKALRDQKISELATDYYDRNGKLDYNFEKEVRAYSKANPMFSPMQIKLYQDSSKRLTEKK